MLTNEQKERRVQWAMAHKDDDWSRTVFSDETSYQLFRNTIRRWSKKKKKRIPKNKQKIMVWGAFSIKGQLSCYSFRTTMDGAFYVEILRKHLLAGARKQFGSRWRYQQDNDPKHTSKVSWKQRSPKRSIGQVTVLILILSKTYGLYSNDV